MDWQNAGRIDGPTGPQGSTGPIGIQGEIGPQGIQGVTGSTGPTGPQEIQGIQGPTGVKGDKGGIAAYAERYMRMATTQTIEANTETMIQLDLTDPLPITAITLYLSFAKSLIFANPEASEIDVEVCPTLKKS